WQSSLMQKITDINDGINNSINTLETNRKELERKYHDSLDKYNNLVENCQIDRYRKDKIKLINSCISRANLWRDYLMKGTINMSIEETIHKFIRDIDGILNRESVIVLKQAEEGSEYNEEHQEIVDTKETMDENLDGKIAVSESPAYIWTLPYILNAKVDEDGNKIHNYRFVIETEKVIIYKLNK
ncbi:MAG: hypothetical protein J5606_03950, partial [Bacteroidales bacterium]|nr:hypothetical protein [Bacteroidales bacterium]